MIDIDGAVRILQANGHSASAQRIMALYDDMERQSELIVALRNEIATWKNGFNAANEALKFAAQRIAELESERNINYVKKLACEVQP